MTIPSPAAPRPRRTDVALALGILAAVLATGSWAGRLLVVDGTAVPGWIPGGAAVVLGLVALALPASPVRRARTRPWVAGLALALAALGLAPLAVADLAGGATYTELSPASPDGCRAMVRQTAFLMAGSGGLYVLRGRTGLARRVAGWTSDDGYRPFDGVVRVRWTDGTGRLGSAVTAGGTSWDATPVVRCR